MIFVAYLIILKLFVNKYYPPLINIYTVWILYMMFFAGYRGDSLPGSSGVRAIPFESIHFLLYDSGYVPLEKYKNIVGNIILFMPYGFLGIMYHQLQKYKYLFVLFFVIINILEFSQCFFSRGFAELDDVMMNTLGMTLGFLIYKKWFMIKDRSPSSRSGG